MGVFDGIYGVISCPHCQCENDIEVQFKFANPAARCYYVGDTIDDSPLQEKYYILRNTYSTCNLCKKTLRVNVIVRHCKVIAIVDDQALLSTPLDAFPDVPDHYFRTLMYEKKCQDGIGRANEQTDFSLHPLPKGSSIVALGHSWTVHTVRRRTVDSGHRHSAWRSFAGGLFRKSDVWYIYTVTHPIFGDRVIIVEDHMYRQIEVLSHYKEGAGYIYEDA